MGKPHGSTVLLNDPYGYRRRERSPQPPPLLGPFGTVPEKREHRRRPHGNQSREASPQPHGGRDDGRERDRAVRMTVQLPSLEASAVIATPAQTGREETSLRRTNPHGSSMTAATSTTVDGIAATQSRTGPTGSRTGAARSHTTPTRSRMGAAGNSTRPTRDRTGAARSRTGPTWSRMGDAWSSNPDGALRKPFSAQKPVTEKEPVSTPERATKEPLPTERPFTTIAERPQGPHGYSIEASRATWLQQRGLKGHTGPAERPQGPHGYSIEASRATWLQQRGLKGHTGPAERPQGPHGASREASRTTRLQQRGLKGHTAPAEKGPDRDPSLPRDPPRPWDPPRDLPRDTIKDSSHDPDGGS